jgi:hypothetical protein
MQTSTERTTFPAAAVQLLFASFFAFAYLASPYWMLPGSWWMRAGVLLLCLGAGAAWSRGIAADVNVPRVESYLPGLVVSAAVLLWLAHRSLGLGIACGGDEPTHVWRVARLYAGIEATTERLFATGGLRYNLPAVAWVLFAVVVLNRRAMARALVAVPPYGRLAAVVAVMLVAAGIGFMLADATGAPRSILRYPFVSKWLSVLPLLVVMPATLTEGMCRLLPFLATAALGAYWARRACGGARLRIPVLLLLLLTTPSLRYYSSLLYLEMPAVLFMTVVCLSAEPLLLRPVADLRHRFDWLCLLSIGFFKETVLPFLATFVCMRALARLADADLRGRPSRDIWTRWLAPSTGTALRVFLPLALFLLFRETMGHIRPVAFHPEHLWDLGLYRIVVVSIGEQAGGLLIPAALGAAMLCRERRFLYLGFLLMTAGASVLLHFVDSPLYVGYSRFNLFALPSLLALAAVGLRACSGARTVLYPLLLLALGVNLSLSPVLSDGGRREGWGTYVYDCSEEVLPLREALEGVDRLGFCSRLFVAGLENDYPFAFYLRRHSPEVRMQDRASIEDTRRWISASFEQAADCGADAVLMVMRRCSRECPAEREQGYRRVRSVRNARGNRIDVFVRTQ